MKKIIALILTIVMLCSFVVAQQGKASDIEPVAISADSGNQAKGDTTQNPVTTSEEQKKANDIEPVKITKENKNQGKVVQNQEMEQSQAKKQVRSGDETKIQEGLTNALSHVKNERAREVLERNMNRWMEKYQSRMNKMKDIKVSNINEETGEVQIKAKEQVKWLGFIKGKATKKFEVDAKGNVNEKARWYSFMYSEIKE